MDPDVDSQSHTSELTSMADNQPTTSVEMEEVALDAASEPTEGMKANASVDISASVEKAFQKVSSQIGDIGAQVEAKVSSLEERLAAIEARDAAQAASTIENKRANLEAKYGLEEGELASLTTVEALDAHERVLEKLNASPMPDRAAPEQVDEKAEAAAAFEAKRQEWLKSLQGGSY